MNIDNYILQKSEKITARLKELLPIYDGRLQTLYEATSYSLFSEGKRLRPILTIATSQVFEVEERYSLDVACCIEMIHTYSLIHDDLPCMDDDDFRRGKPTLHKVYPEAIAVLTGDFLLTFAFEVLANIENLSDAKKNLLIQVLAKRSGAMGMIGGQVIDILSQGKEIDLDTLIRMHTHKTASLLSACLEFGAILGDATTEERRSLVAIGEKIGLAYQIQDDILDTTPTSEILGKYVRSDIEKEKATSVACLGIKGALKKIHQLKDEAHSILQKIKKDTKILEDLLEKILFKNS